MKDLSHRERTLKHSRGMARNFHDIHTYVDIVKNKEFNKAMERNVVPC